MSDGKGSMSYFKVTLPGFSASSFPWDAHISSDGVLGLAARQRNTINYITCVSHVCYTSRPYRNAQTRLLWRGGGMPCTFLCHHELESVLVMITAVIVQHQSAKLMSMQSHAVTYWT